MRKAVEPEGFAKGRARSDSVFVQGGIEDDPRVSLRLLNNLSVCATMGKVIFNSGTISSHSLIMACA